MIVTMDA
jgi:hypothetical protein